MNTMTCGAAEAASDLSDIWLIGCSRSQPISLPKHDTTSGRRYWRSNVGREIPNVLRQDMSIGPIPEISELSDAEICGVFPDPAWTDPHTGEVRTKPISEFLEIMVEGRIGGGNKYALFDVLAALSCDSRISDDVRLRVYGMGWGGYLQEGTPYADWMTVGALRKTCFPVRKRLRFLLTRNTMPLLTSSMFMMASGPDLQDDALLANAADIQYLYRVREGKGDYDVMKHYMGAGLGMASLRLCSYDHDREEGIVRATLSAEGEMILDTMHPSARDPKFFDRFEEWVRDWPESRDAAYGWIRTWAGRLKRLQARRHKKGVLIRNRLDPLIDIYESHAWEALIASRTGDPFEKAMYLDVIGVLSHALAPEFHMKTDAIRPHVTMLLYERRSKQNAATADPDPVILRRISSVASSILRNCVLQTRFRQRGPVLTDAKKRILNDLPRLWMSGVKHTVDAYLDGARSSYALLGDYGDHPPGTDSDLTEFMRKAGPTPDDEWRTGWDPCCVEYQIVADVSGLDPWDAGSRLAFLRGKFAAWYVLTSVSDQDILSEAMTEEIVVSRATREVKI